LGRLLFLANGSITVVRQSYSPAPQTKTSILWAVVSDRRDSGWRRTCFQGCEQSIRSTFFACKRFDQKSAKPFASGLTADRYRSRRAAMRWVSIVPLDGYQLRRGPIMNLSWHPEEDATPTPRDVEVMAAVLEGRHGQLAADVADFFVSLHEVRGDAGRSWAWAGVAEKVRLRERDRLTGLGRA
jgi:hypothetical protein